MDRRPRQRPPGHEELERPWERPGVARRDCIPHRGPLLRAMAFAGLIGGVFSPCLVGLPALVGLPLAIAAWLLARRDLSEMQAGLMDPAGQRYTGLARDAGAGGLLVNALGLALSGLVLWELFWQW